MFDKNQILTAIQDYEPITLKETEVSAAVMIILLIDKQQGISILLTQRTANLHTYAGDFSFPGGLREIIDANLQQTAFREIHEELGLQKEDLQLIGQLDDFEDRFGHLVRAFVATMDKQIFEEKSRPSPDEIAKIYYFPLEKLSELKDDPNLHTITRRQPSYSYKTSGVFIWGLTAAILVHLFNIIAHMHKPLGKTIEK